MNPSKSKNEAYPLFVSWYQTFSYILDRTEAIPKSARFSLAGRMADEAREVLEDILAAIYAHETEKLIPLSRINLRLEKLRVFFRICFDRRYISEKQYGYISARIDEAGRMTGGWIKSLQAKEKKDISTKP
ncbi:MAG: diversity-generating retroelement protein Avd [Bacteroidia bacterium]|nr:diversity-generating retroelement protein Avd [Bacteroidia bacterium]